MRAALLTIIVLVGGPAMAQGLPEGGRVGGGGEAARAALAMKIAREAVGGYTVRPTGGGPALALEPDPVLKATNPVMGSVYGAVYVWTAGGRPEVVTTVFKNFSPARHVGVEFHSLATGKVVAERDGKEVWSPGRAGVEPKPVLGAPEVADTRAGRLRQMRALAEQFSGAETNEGNVTRDLRLLTNPVFRYKGPGAGVVDGALFAFVQGTDPQAVLLIEARQGARGRPEWTFALARMAYLGLKVTHRGHPVWGAPLLPWWEPSTKLYDRREPYTEFVFHPGEGANPTDDPGRVPRP